MSDPGRRFIVDRESHGQRLDRFLADRIPVSRSRLQRVIPERVTVSWGPRADPATRVRGGGIVEFGFSTIEEIERNDPLPVLARGAGWLAVDKPAGIPVHPTESVRVNSLIRMIRRAQTDPELRLVHRLDRETSGVLLLASNRSTAARLARAFEEGRVIKEYLALVVGRPAGTAGTIDWPIGPDRESPLRVKLTSGPAIDPDGCRPARTDWQRVATDAGTSLLRVRPHTGRRHQIRVHLAALGHPLVGDLLYGYPPEAYLALAREGRDARIVVGRAPRHMLHCARLDFPEPEGRERARVVAPTPNTFVQ